MVYALPVSATVVGNINIALKPIIIYAYYMPDMVIP